MLVALTGCSLGGGTLVEEDPTFPSFSQKVATAPCIEAEAEQSGISYSQLLSGLRETNSFGDGNLSINGGHITIVDGISRKMKSFDIPLFNSLSSLSPLPGLGIGPPDDPIHGFQASPSQGNIRKIVPSGASFVLEDRVNPKSRYLLQRDGSSYNAADSLLRRGTRLRATVVGNPRNGLPWEPPQRSGSKIQNPKSNHFLTAESCQNNREAIDLLMGEVRPVNPQVAASLQTPSDRSHSTPQSIGKSLSITLPVPAFPSAEGFGATSVGGRGGRIIEVINLNDDGPGSLRAALEAKGSRIVVFRVAGIIELHDEIRIKNPYLTVAGQTAPGGGITLKGSDNSLLRIDKTAHDIVIRYLRLRNGSGKANGSGHDNLSINGGYNIIIEHVSMSWSTDENASIYRKQDDPPVYNVTIQRSMMAEGLGGHSNGMIIGGKFDYSAPNHLSEDWRKISNITVHHNLFAHNTHRNPRVTSAGAQVINNVMYNWKYRIGETTRGSIIDVINNYAKGGPMSNLKRLFLHENYNPEHPEEPYPNPSIYTAGNVVQSVFTKTNADNWRLWKLNYFDTPLPKQYHRYTPLPEAPIPVSRQTAYEAYDSVLADVGANARLDCLGNWVPNADSIDGRILAEVQNNTGPAAPINKPNQVGGYPQIAPGIPCQDSDHDGMPDAWENMQGFNPNNPTDGSADADGDGYTNVEEYLNG